MQLEWLSRAVRFFGASVSVKGNLSGGILDSHCPKSTDLGANQTGPRAPAFGKSTMIHPQKWL